MSINTFIIVSALINILLCFLIRFKSYRFQIAYPLFGLAILFPFNSILGNSLWGTHVSFFGVSKAFAAQAYFASYIATTLLMKDFAKNFLRDETIKLPFLFYKFNFSLTSLLWLFGIGAIAACMVTPVLQQFIVGGVVITVLTTAGIGVVFCQLIIALYALFIVENTYRFSQEYQRKIARLCFLSLCTLVIFQLFFSCRFLLYKVLTPNVANVAAVVYGVTYPVLLIGLLRYRLNAEHIAVPRNAVYSTVSLLLSGSAFIGIGITVFVFKQFQINFDYFEETLLIFSLCIFAVLGIGSGTMRKRISRFVNNYFYSRKFDYREQFINLHRSYMTGENVEGTLTEIIENMKYSVEADDAFIFIANESDGHLYMHQNKESATVSDCVIRGDSGIVRELSQSLSPIHLEGRRAKEPADTGELLLRETIKTDILFPIVNRGSLLGILALRLGAKKRLDTEDGMLIEVFAKSIGDVLFKNKVLTERVERKQFESFSHLSSFIIHDIKNQIATLSLVVRNAGNNIANPDFQKSLLSSVRSCTENLQRLVEKLKSPPRLDSLKMRLVNVAAIVERVVENTGIGTVSQVKVVVKNESSVALELDEESLFYTLKNFVMNALDSMNNRGELSIWTGRLVPEAPGELQRLFDYGKDFFAPYKVFIMVSDTGGGMTPEFMERKLFHPFITTKDKGIGIGLYQCKTLIEKMGGKILCHSELGRGTDFCILL